MFAAHHSNRYGKGVCRHLNRHCLTAARQDAENHSFIGVIFIVDNPGKGYRHHPKAGLIDRNYVAASKV
ncbi:MAG: hypothetical protein KUG52_04160 [Immundisolibacteraceae bacterium]|nr:hypothetical protein [Immundisolibacteraceae bacterium]